MSLEQKANQYVLTIRDTGIGISKEYLDKIYHAFTQENEGYTKKFQRIGLGMSIAKRHLDINQIDISIESTPDVGTTCTLTFRKDPGEKPAKGLPSKQNAEEEALEITPTTEITEKPLILLVEDNPSSRKLIEFFLNGKYDICIADSVIKAKTQLENMPVDLTLLDLSLVGEEDGLSLVRWMRKTRKWQNLPVIATTAHAFTTDRKNCLEAGCNDYLSKPINRELLFEKIRACLDKKSI